jgi:peptide/nickel transport system permease protein
MNRPSLSHCLHRLQQDPAVALSVVCLVVLYGSVALAGVLAPYSPYHTWPNKASAPPTPVYGLARPRLKVRMHSGECRDGWGPAQFVWPYVLDVERQWNPKTYEYRYLPNLTHTYRLQWWVKGDAYKLLGFIPANHHLVGLDAPTESQAGLHLLGTDSNGRDVFSRLLYGGQISLTIGFLSLLIAIPIGLFVGGLSGYVGGWLDMALMRLAEVVMSIPSLFLLISLAALLPASLSSSARFALVTAIMALIGWAGFARVIRGMVLSLRDTDFVEAARAMGASRSRILWRHVLPQTLSYVMVTLTLGVPGYLLAESGLSFLGLGIQPPDASWGNLLKEAQEITNLIERPWLMAPGVLIFVAVLSFNVVGDTVRDWLDPKQPVSR